MMDRDTGIGRIIKNRVNDPDTLLRTTDGGKSWALSYVGKGYGIHKFSNGEWVAISETGDANNQWLLLRSNNYGKTWSVTNKSSIPTSFRVQAAKWGKFGELYLFGKNASIYYSADSLQSTVLLQGEVTELTSNLRVAVNDDDAYLYNWNGGWNDDPFFARRSLAPSYTTTVADQVVPHISYGIRDGSIIVHGGIDGMKIELYDVVGIIVFQATLHGFDKEQIQLPQQLHGLYFCLLGFGSQNLTHPTPFPFPALGLVF
ncbi:MAG: hypothetical protein IT211_10725 [Armatimonadetes bacterium]|nr:hypothetical protein [Armatimonadota bacterium]